MRPTTTLMLALTSTAMLVAGCSDRKDGSSASGAAAEQSADAGAPNGSSSREAARDSAAAAPDIAGNAAPGVAFTYRYAFTLPAKAIANVQNDHAAACEKLGLSRCRIIGMDYRKDGGEAIAGRLDLLLAPDIAHRYTRDAAELVERADGRLADADVTGENAGGEIELSQGNSAALEAELARLEKRLQTSGLLREERTGLTARTESMREQLRGEAAHRIAREKSIATTPVSFSYASEGLLTGTSDPLGTAAKTSWGSMATMLSVVLTLLGLIAPWALLAALVWLAWRGLRARRAVPVTTPPADPA